jgi:hypothetical protein
MSKRRPRRRSLGLAIALTVVVAACAIAIPSALRPATEGSVTVGLSSAYNLGQVRREQPELKVLRDDICWADLEPTRGRYQWRQRDAFMAEAARNGFTTVPVLNCSPPWTGLGHFVLPTTSADVRAFSRMVADVVARYGPRGSFWRAHPRLPYRPARWFEIWNEPYLAEFMQNPGGPNPVSYARLVKAAVMAGRARNPRARFLIEADTTGLPVSGPQVEWVDAMFAAVPDLARWIDGVAVHPYSNGASPDEYTPSGDTRWQFRRIEQIHDRFAAHGAGGKPFWITEIGWSTCAKRPPCVTESQQGQYLARMLELARGYGWVKAVLVYNYRDDQQAGQAPAETGRWYGLLRSDGRPKPAWQALRRAIRP